MKTAEKIFAEASSGRYIFRSTDIGIAKEMHEIVYRAMKIYAIQKLDEAINIIDFSSDIIQPFEHNKELIESLKDEL